MESMEIYLNPPKRIETTVAEFRALKIFEVASFFINYGVCLEEKEGSIRIWTQRWSLFERCDRSKRFKEVNWYEIEEVELYYCDVTDEKLKNTLRTRFEDKFLR